jgi:monoamine oxidase
MPDLELVIVGAGAAGTGAALEARRRGLAFRVLEAKRRSGGRAWTDLSSLCRPFDLGCHWLHSASENPLRTLADELGVASAEDAPKLLHDGRRFLAADEVRECLAAWASFGAAARSSDAAARDRSVAEMCECRSRWYPYFAQWMEHESAASLDELSTEDWAAQRNSGEDRPVPGGYGDLLRRVLGGIPVELETPVRALDLAGPRVAIETPRGTLRAAHVLLTVSTAVLAAGSIALRPDSWPLWKLRAIEGLPLGSSTKVALEVDPIAIDPALRNRFVHCLAEAPANISWHLAPHGFEMAVAYLGGAFSRGLACAGEAEQIAFAASHLASVLGSEVRRHIGRGRATPFDTDPWLGGGYSYGRVGYGNQRAALALPIDERIHFAGEACSVEFPATAHGAFLSGIAAVAGIAARRASAAREATGMPGARTARRE